MKIGITGSRGFIGSHLARELKAQGHKLFFFNLPENDLLKSGKNLENFVDIFLLSDTAKFAISFPSLVNRDDNSKKYRSAPPATYINLFI